MNRLKILKRKDIIERITVHSVIQEARKIFPELAPEAAVKEYMAVQSKVIQFSGSEINKYYATLRYRLLILPYTFFNDWRRN